MDLREKVAEALYEAPDQLVAESAFGGLVRGEQRRQANERADKVMPVVSAHVDTMAAVIEQQRQRIKELEGALASAGDFCTRPNACGALMDAALERARENGDRK